jgi:hypothetical protein
MAVKTATLTIDAIRRHPHLVVHPLFDTPEQKLDVNHLPPIRMTRSVKLSLAALRAYLVLMTLMLGYHFLDLAGMFGIHAR